MTRQNPVLAAVEGLVRNARAFLAEEDVSFTGAQRPPVAGSPANLEHAAGLRIAYGLIAALLGLTAGLGAAFVLVNVDTLQAAMGLDAAQAAWLPTAYVMTSVSANLILIKFRQSYGLRPFAVLFLTLYALLAVGHLLMSDFAHAMALRAASGIAGAALIPLCLFYMMQALPGRWRIRGLVAGLGIIQCGAPLALVLSPHLLDGADWRSLFQLEAGLALLALAAVSLVRLPPTERSQTFEPLDFMTFLLLGAALALITAMTGVGHAYGWPVAWLAATAAVAVPAIGLATGIELKRNNPLIDLRWLLRSEVARFAIAVLMARLVLTEQAVASDLLEVLGAHSGQMQVLALLVLAGAAAGVLVSTLTVNVEKLARPMMLAIAVIALAALLESAPADLTALPRFYASQFAIAFAGTYFLGPALLLGLLEALRRGSRELISFIVLFGLINAFGAVLGHALLETYRDMAEAGHKATQLIAGGAEADAAHPYAAVLALQDTLRLVAILAAATALYLALLLGLRIHKRLAELRAASTAGPSSPMTAVSAAEPTLTPGWTPPATSLTGRLVLGAVAIVGVVLMVGA